MKRLILLCALLCTFPLLVRAESLQVNYTEPTATATLAYTTISWCKGASCTNWLPVSRVASDDGNGADAKSITINIPLNQSELPVTVRVRVTATDTAGNETSGVIDTHTFSAS